MAAMKLRVLELMEALRTSRQRRVQLAAVKQLAGLLVASAEAHSRVLSGEMQPMQELQLHGVFLEAGGMQTAVRLLSSNLNKADMAELLRSACLVPAAADELAAAGGVEPLVQLLGDTSTPAGRAAHSAALLALGDAATSSDAVRDAAVAAGCVPLLVAVIQGVIDFDFDAVIAVQMLGELALRHQEALLAAGTVQELVRLVAQPCMPGPALKALNRLTAQAGSRPGHAEVAAAVAAAGGIAAAVPFLRVEAAQGRRMQFEFSVPQLAAGLLGNLAAAGAELAAQVQAAGAVPLLESMLRHCVHADERGSAATALASIRRAAAAAAAAAAKAPSQPARPRRTCAAPGCGHTHSLKRCGGCGKVRYCSQECCTAHWPDHKAECRRQRAETAAAARAVAAEAGAAEAVAPEVGVAFSPQEEAGNSSDAT